MFNLPGLWEKGFRRGGRRRRLEFRFRFRRRRRRWLCCPGYPVPTVVVFRLRGSLVSLGDVPNPVLLLQVVHLLLLLFGHRILRLGFSRHHLGGLCHHLVGVLLHQLGLLGGGLCHGLELLLPLLLLLLLPLRRRLPVHALGPHRHSVVAHVHVLAGADLLLLLGNHLGRELPLGFGSPVLRRSNSRSLRRRKKNPLRRLKKMLHSPTKY